jgi:putative methionine-R-sulfoxide reductase with GAF domain
MDNAILVIAGDAIDTSLGVMFGMSTLCAAAIGNIISDLCGIGLGTIIEDFCANTLKLPVPQLTTAQRQLRSVRYASQFGTAVGMTIGCILGMFPLLFIDTHKADKLRKKAQLENLFQDVVLGGRTLVAAEITTLYLRVNKDEHAISERDKKISSSDNNGFVSWISSFFIFGSGSSGGSSSSSGGLSVLPYKPSASGEYLYAMYYMIPASVAQSTQPKQVGLSTPVRHRDSTLAKEGHHTPKASLQHCLHDKLIPLGRGIVSRALLTGDTWNIADVSDEPDFFPMISATATSTGGMTHSNQGSFRNLVVVPILDGRGRAIGVLEAINKIHNEATKEEEEEEGFTNQDVEILKSLASHISVSLQVFYQDSEEGEVRLRDTIRIFKEMGIQGVTESTGMDGQHNNSNSARISGLFPSSSSTPPSKVTQSKTSKLFPVD